ncbi:hypothetical protein F2Q69_00014735 [Brassica cretica]|uniref:Protein kinase domain-containing protein n=1 Tax=Brassica cretica TaxID=69181 RepID=A0A8S9QPV1_BRACR|nr:hypothetical protein F2Q69_00014735 [Brassica cretica]
MLCCRRSKKKEMKKRKEKRRDEEGDSLIAREEDEFCTRACDHRSKKKKHRVTESRNHRLALFPAEANKKSVAGLIVFPHPARPTTKRAIISLPNPAPQWTFTGQAHLLPVACFNQEPCLRQESLSNSLSKTTMHFIILGLYFNKAFDTEFYENTVSIPLHTEGGFASVWLGKNKHDGREYALKLIKSNANTYTLNCAMLRIHRHRLDEVGYNVDDDFAWKTLRQVLDGLAKFLDKDEACIDMTTSKNTAESNKKGTTLYVAHEIVKGAIAVQLKHMFFENLDKRPTVSKLHTKYGLVR